MCIAICKKAGLALKENILERCFNANPDGAGFAVEEADGSFLIQKGFFSFKDFMDAFLPHEKKKALIHFRIKTHGLLDKNNCHPFEISDNITFIHNGIISNVEYDETKSDTIIFNEQYLKTIVDTFGEQALLNPVIQKLIESFIGASKLAFMIKGQEEFLIFNQNKGNTSAEGIWFSNLSWQTPIFTPQLVYYPKTSYKKGKPHQSTSHCPPSFIKSEVPLLQTGRGAFSFGTLVRTNSDTNHITGTIPKGTLGEVHAVYNNYSLDIDFYNTLGLIQEVPLFSLEIIEDWTNYDTLNGNYND